MNRVLRVLVAWLLLFALPLQGYAAGTMTFCGGNGAASASAPHSHEGATAQDGSQDHPHEASVADTEGFMSVHAVTHGKCSVCASCCGGAAPPSTMNLLSAPAVPRTAPLLMTQHDVPDDSSARLERPPRLNLV